MIGTRKYKKQWTESKGYGIYFDIFQGTYTLDIYWGHSVYVIFKRRY